MTHARRAPALALAIASLFLAAPGCHCGAGDSDAGIDAGTDAGPPTTIEELPIDAELSFPGLTADVDIVRDVYGVPHIYAQNVYDLFFANGWVHANDRMAQMVLFRAFAKGELAELGGSLSPSLVDDDISMRVLGLARVGQQIYDAIDPASELRIALDAYADGVNAYIAKLQSFELTLPAGAEFLNVAYIKPWSGADSITFGRLMSYNLSFDGDSDISRTAALEAMLATFDGADPVTEPDLAARAGWWGDAARCAPAVPATVLPGIPNYPTDMGTTAVVLAGPPRPIVSAALLDSAYATLRKPFLSPFNPFRADDRGSNDWVVSGDVTESGFPLLANDPHLSLDNPSIFYEIHLDLTRMAAAEPSVVGIGFPAAPGVIIGHNQDIAWGVTTAGFDVTDVYRETVVDCPAGGTLNCVLFNGTPVPIETITEDVGVGLGGLVVNTVPAVLESVPQHGPIIPTILNGAVVPRTTGEALTYRWTGFEPSSEIAAFVGLMRAHTWDEAHDAIDSFRVGAQNFVVATVDGDIGYTANARIPIRAPAAFDFTYPGNPTGNAPFLILDGGGAFEWTGDMDDRYVPHTVNPAAGFVSTANNDQVGTTLDNDALHGGAEGDLGFYYGADFDPGFRDGRIKERLTAEIAGDGVSFDDMQAIQNDEQSALGRRLTPELLTSMAALEAHLDGSAPRPDLAAFAAGLDPATLDLMREATMRLAAWDYRAADGVEVETAPADVDSAVATSIFNRWLTRTVTATFDDEVAAVGHDLDRVKTLLHLVEDVGALLIGLNPDTGDAIAFDDLGTPELESKDLVFVQALAGAVDDLANTCCGAADAAGFGSTDMSTWRWGLLHTLRLESMVPSLAMVNILDNPRSDDPEYGLDGSVSYGFPRHGDLYGVDAANFGRSFDYTYGSGPVMRMVVEVEDGVMRTENVVPGGEVYDSASPHFGDLMELWRKNETHPVAYWEAEVVAAYESRTVLHPEGN